MHSKRRTRNQPDSDLLQLKWLSNQSRIVKEPVLRDNGSKVYHMCPVFFNLLMFSDTQCAARARVAPGYVVRYNPNRLKSVAHSEISFPFECAGIEPHPSSTPSVRGVYHCSPKQ